MPIKWVEEAISYANFPRLFLLDACSLPADLRSVIERCRSRLPGSKFLALVPPSDSNYVDATRLFYWGIEGFVVAVSVDRKGMEAVQKLFRERDVKKLPIYIDRSSEALRAVRAVGLPTSLFIDREGREFGRVVGPAQWDDPATIAFFRHVVAREVKP